MFPAFQIAPPLPFIPEDRHGDTFIALVGCWAGPVEQGEEAFKPFHDVAPVVAEFVGPMPYPALNSAFDALVPARRSSTTGRRASSKELTDEAIAAHVTHGSEGARRELHDAHLPDQRRVPPRGRRTRRRSRTATRTSPR